MNGRGSSTHNASATKSIAYTYIYIYIYIFPSPGVFSFFPAGPTCSSFLTAQRGAGSGVGLSGGEQDATSGLGLSLVGEDEHAVASGLEVLDGEGVHHDGGAAAGRGGGGLAGGDLRVKSRWRKRTRGGGRVTVRVRETTPRGRKKKKKDGKCT